MLTQAHAYWRAQPLEMGSVLYESFAGNGMLCNPEALFRELLVAPDLRHLTHIWVLSDKDRYRATMSEFAHNKNVRFVRHGSPAYFRALATSEYLINNATFPTQFSKRRGQTYLNTWHGTPLKRMGYDIEAGALGTANIIRNFVAADYLLAANSFMTDQMYATAYKLRGIYRGQIIEEGYPRIDRQFLDADAVRAGRARLNAAGIDLDDRAIVLYAPTWKGAAFAHPQDDLDQLVDTVAQIQAGIDSSRYVVLLKAHQIVHKLADNRPGLKRLMVPNSIPTNVVLGLTEVLISDYSSIYFDFLATGRPVLFFTPDLDDYSDTRGVYFQPQDWPGPVCRTVGEVTAEILAFQATGSLSVESAERYRTAQSNFCDQEDGAASARIIDIVFRGNTAGRRIRADFTDERTSIMIYLGGMMSNGITTSALNLLNNIDHTRFDVSVHFPSTTDSAAIANQLSINSNVRQFPRVGGMNGQATRQLIRYLDFRRGRLHNHQQDSAQNTLWDDEWTRCFGDSRFDYVVDFSGYGPFWAALLLHSPGSIRSIWLHNDMTKDAHRTVAGQKKMLHSLTQIFALYAHYDHLVSVSAALAAINRRELAPYADADRFTFAVNTADADQILRRASEDLRSLTDNSALGTTPPWVDRLLAGGDTVTFMTVGRLSPEKNQARLIRAFAALHEEHPATRLVLVGDGPLRPELEALITQLLLEDAVILTGAQPNPYAVLKQADCFVMSSDYEGQPMVILEALVLGLPIVTVAFESVTDALPPGLGLIVAQTDTALTAGLLLFLQGDVPPTTFNHTHYTELAIEAFYQAIGTRPVPNAVGR